MLFLGIILLLLAIAWTPVRIRPIAFNRLAILVLLYSSLLAFVNVSWHLGPMDLGIGIFGGFYHVTILSQSFDCFIQLLAAIILLLGASKHPFVILIQNPSTAHYLRGCVAMRHVAEYPLVILFTTLGMSSLISSSDLLSMFLSIELQTLALYILATIYRDSEAATSAGLKYLLIGALSSSLILLGSSLLYGFTGVSSFEGLYLLCSMGVGVPNRGIILALLIIGIALLFKVAAAPFHNWAPDVYDGVPTNVTTWLAIMPKLAILAFLAELQGFTHLSLPGTLDWGNILLVSALLSLLIGAVVGLAQYRIKRLLAYSTISHMGFLLLALAIHSAEGIEAFIFYLVQYALTSTNIFFVLVAFGNNPMFLRNFRGEGSSSVALEDSAENIFHIMHMHLVKSNPALGLSLAISLFSMAGLPPLIGFFAKLSVLYSASQQGFFFLAVVAVTTSVVSGGYYLRVVRVIMHEQPLTEFAHPLLRNGLRHYVPNVSLMDHRSIIDDVASLREWAAEVTPAPSQVTSQRFDPLPVPLPNATHSMVIASLTLLILLFLAKPSLLLNSQHLLGASLFFY